MSFLSSLTFEKITKNMCSNWFSNLHHIHPFECFSFRYLSQHLSLDQWQVLSFKFLLCFIEVSLFILILVAFLLFLTTTINLFCVKFL